MPENAPRFPRLSDASGTSGPDRRKFLMAMLAAVPGVSLLRLPRAARSHPAAGFGPAKGSSEPLTIRRVIDMLQADIPGAPFKDTVDTIKFGNPDQPVKGIVTTMFSTDEIIEKTAKLGANFIIAHEPTFYNHTDETAWLGDDPVLKFKRDLLEKHGIVVWRFHDGMHAHRPDIIRMGVLVDLQWQDLYTEGSPLLTLPQAFPLEKLISYMKHLLGIQHVKYIGDPVQACKTVVISPGAGGGRSQIGMIQKYQPDVFVCGELNEWETSEYIRDARYQGSKTALVVLGHSVSEESGLEVLLSMLNQKLPGVPVTHLPSSDPFAWA